MYEMVRYYNTPGSSLTKIQCTVCNPVKLRIFDSKIVLVVTTRIDVLSYRAALMRHYCSVHPRVLVSPVGGDHRPAGRPHFVRSQNRQQRLATIAFGDTGCWNGAARTPIWLVTRTRRALGSDSLAPSCFVLGSNTGKSYRRSCTVSSPTTTATHSTAALAASLAASYSEYNPAKHSHTSVLQARDTVARCSTRPSAPILAGRFISDG